VPLFFALSGYIIAVPFLGPNPPALGKYFLRRLTRLEPPYIVSMLVVFALKVTVLGVAASALLPHLLASLAYLHGPIYGTHSEVNGVAWSLEVEWQFYALAPLLFGLLLRSPAHWRDAGLWALLALGGVIHQQAGLLTARLGLSLLHYLGFFVAGAWVASCERRTPRAGGSARHDLLGAASAACILAILLRALPWVGLLPALTALLLYAALRGPWLKRLLGWWPLCCIGAMCYSIYLYHFFVVSLIGRVFARWPGWPQQADPALLLMVGIGLPVVLAACAVPYLLVERPFMVWRPGRNRLRDGFSWRSPA
jgi:peptidoglycan/LPS O-acetylase OafA/YrhL